jgi:hypothetical protein
VASQQSATSVIPVNLTSWIRFSDHALITTKLAADLAAPCPDAITSPPGTRFTLHTEYALCVNQLQIRMLERRRKKFEHEAAGLKIAKAKSDAGFALL